MKKIITFNAQHFSNSVEHQGALSFPTGPREGRAPFCPPSKPTTVPVKEFLLREVQQKVTKNWPVGKAGGRKERISVSCVGILVKRRTDSLFRRKLTSLHQAHKERVAI